MPLLRRLPALTSLPAGSFTHPCMHVLQDGGSQLQVEVGGERQEVALASTRACLQFSQGRRPPAPAPAAGAAAEGEGAAQPATKKRGKKKQAQAAEVPQARAGEPAAEAAEPAGGGGGADEPAGKRRRAGGRKQQHPVAASAGDGALPAEAEAGATPGATAATPASPAKGGKKAGGGGSGKKAAPAYAVPAGFDASLLPPVDLSSAKAAKNSAPLAVTRRFLGLRRALPAAGEPAAVAAWGIVRGPAAVSCPFACRCHSQSSTSLRSCPAPSPTRPTALQSCPPTSPAAAT